MGQDRQVLPGTWLPVSLMLLVTAGTMMALLGSHSGKSVYEFLKDWQSMLAAIIAGLIAGAALVPVWKQVRAAGLQIDRISDQTRVMSDQLANSAAQLQVVRNQFDMERSDRLFRTLKPFDRAVAACDALEDATGRPLFRFFNLTDAELEEAGRRLLDAIDVLEDALAEVPIPDVGNRALQASRNVTMMLGHFLRRRQFEAPADLRTPLAGWSQLMQISIRGDESDVEHAKKAVRELRSFLRQQRDTRAETVRLLSGWTNPLLGTRADEFFADPSGWPR